ncbi:MAG: CvpA family protein [Clostridia bacterium]|nr:CvpA family protein [Clostridia bacterium]
MILDAIFIAVLVCAVWIGVKRGFIRSIIGFITLLLSIVLAMFFYQRFLDFVQTVPFLRQLQEQISLTIAQTAAPMLADNLDTLPPFIMRFIPQEMVMSGVQNVCDWIAQSLTQVLLFLIFTILLHIVIRLCAMLLLALTHLPVIRQCNRLLGGGFGAVTGILLCYLLAAVIFIISMNPAYSWLSDELSRSIICSYFYTNNLIVNLVLGFR